MLAGGGTACIASGSGNDVQPTTRPYTLAIEWTLGPMPGDNPSKVTEA